MSQVRERTLVDLRDFAAKILAHDPKARSVMLCIAQYWAAEQEDAVHAYVVVSERTTPLWPHECFDTSDVPTVGESCEYCSDVGSLQFDGNEPDTIRAFEPYCLEGAEEADMPEDSFAPYAIARRTDHSIEIEVVGHLLHPESELIDEDARDDAQKAAKAFDERAEELFEIACANPTDDGPRRVLADYLLEREDPRGEFIALSLAENLDATAIARRDSLLAEHLWSWIDPLSHVVPRGCARFERGLLAHVEVFADAASANAVKRGAEAWRSVETLRYLPYSVSVFDSRVMRALRVVEQVRGEGILALSGSDPPWNIESLHVAFHHADEVGALVDTQALPRLRRLAITLSSDSEREALVVLPHAPWWNQLDCLTLLDTFDNVASFLGRGEPFDTLPRVATGEVGASGGPAGWCFTLDQRDRTNCILEVSLLDFCSTSSRAKLAEQLERLPDVRTVLVRSAKWEPTEDDVAVLSRSGRGISIR